MYAPAATQCVNLSFSVYRRMCPGGTTCSEVLTILLLPDGCPHPRGPSGRTANSARRGQSIRPPWRRCRATSAAPSARSLDGEAVEGAAEVARQRRHGGRIDWPRRALFAVRPEGPRG